jgi:hypothetical protein
VILSRSPGDRYPHDRAAVLNCGIQHRGVITANRSPSQSSGLGSGQGSSNGSGGFAEGLEGDPVAFDVGIAGGSASAEEAAIHLTEDPPSSWYDSRIYIDLVGVSAQVS